MDLSNKPQIKALKKKLRKKNRKIGECNKRIEKLSAELKELDVYKELFDDSPTVRNISSQKYDDIDIIKEYKQQTEKIIDEVNFYRQNLLKLHGFDPVSCNQMDKIKKQLKEVEMSNDENSRRIEKYHRIVNALSKNKELYKFQYFKDCHPELHRMSLVVEEKH